MRISRSDDDDEEDENEKAEIDEARVDTFTLKFHLDTLEAYPFLGVCSPNSCRVMYRLSFPLVS